MIDPTMHDLLTAFGQAYHKLLTEGTAHASAVEAAEAAIIARTIEPTASAVMNVLAEWDAEPDNGSLVDLALRILEARRKARSAENRDARPFELSLRDR